MSEEIKAMLEENVKHNLELMNTVEPESEAYKTLSESTQNMLKILNEDGKITADYDIKYRTVENERIEKENQAAEQKKDRRLKIGMWAIGGIGSAASLWAMAGRLLEFEKTGTLVSSVSRSLFSGLFRKK